MRWRMCYAEKQARMDLMKRGMEELEMEPEHHKRELCQAGDWVEVGAHLEIEEMLHRQHRAFRTQVDLVDQSSRLDSSPG